MFYFFITFSDFCILIYQFNVNYFCCAEKVTHFQVYQEMTVEEWDMSEM